MDASQVARLCKLFELGEPISKPQAVKGGLLHRLWRLTTTGGTFAVKQLNPVIMRKKPNIRDVYRFTERIAAAMAMEDVPAVVALNGQGDGGTVQEIGDATFMVYDWIEGETLSTGPVELERTRLIGAILARMHSLHQQFPELEFYNWEAFNDEEWSILTFQAVDRSIPWAHLVRAALPQIIAWSRLDEEANKVLRSSYVVSHRDLDQKNVIWRNAITPAVIDWEAAGTINPTMELVSTALSWSGQSAGEPREDSFAALLEGYVNASGVIRDPGSIAIHGVMGNWLGWLLFNMHRSLGESVNSEEERLLGVRETVNTLATLHSLANNAKLWARWVDKYR